MSCLGSRGTRRPSNGTGPSHASDAEAQPVPRARESKRIPGTCVNRRNVKSSPIHVAPPPVRRESHFDHGGYQCQLMESVGESVGTAG